MAYQLLINEGYLIARGPAGTVVSPLLKPARPGHRSISPMTLHKPLVHSGERPLPLQMGLPALDAFPGKLWNRLAGQTLRDADIDSLIYPDARGDSSLRNAVAGYLGVSRGIACSPEQVFIVAGYRAGLDLICRSLLQQGDRCWIENPGYFTARDFFREAGATLIPVPVDAEGMVIEHGIEQAPDAGFAIVTPAHQSPLCVALSMPRRQALLDWANRRKSWIVEDDYDSEYRYLGHPLPALKSLDTQERVLYCGTFSKVLMPGLRLSYLVVPQALVPHFAEVADKMHSHCPRIWQATTARFIEEGHFARHLKKMRALYAIRRQLLVDAIQANLSQWLSISPQVGGMHLLARLPQGADDRIIAARALAAGLRVYALSDWSLPPSIEQGLLIGFTNVTTREQALALTARLAQVFRDHCTRRG